MHLGGRGSRWRCLLVWASGTSTLATVVLFLRPQLSRAWDARGSLDTMAMDRAVVDLASAVLLACVAWAWLTLTATVIEAWRGVGPMRRRPWHPPAGVHRALLTACGIALTTSVAAPVLATDGGQRHQHHHVHHGRHGAALLDGLPLPERAVAPAAARGSRGTAHKVLVRSVLVRPGDCLWSIAAHDAGPGASVSAISARVRAIYAANHTLIGADPGLIRPGQRLRLPHPGLPRKDQR